MAAISAKTARLDARIPPELHAQLRRAAEIQGRSLSDYVTSALRAATARDIEEAEVIRLSREASERFAAVLIDPAPPSQALIAAIEEHRRLVEPR